ncbi:granulin a isoform X2 [Danio aesculapii]|uniref:granulin a isoform X2 n=1 Tax=Danio aesculapii TaxID=1142201 RepID=UPI0024C0E127|nr:granulin a isoform X2 [Danio aesculapii]
MLRLTVGLAVVTLVICSQCPNNEVCEAGQSCCQDPTGGFSCCPFHHGECCEDHLHCCPEGMLCSVKDLTCTNATHTQPFADRTQAKKPDLPKSFRMIFSMPASESDISCPDGSSCPAEFSCLLMSTSYGCCPVAQGLACSDGKHCCPNDYECSTDSSLCVKRKVKVQTVLCGNGTTECPEDTTCCLAEDGQWGCCPMPKAVCCDDKVHCCPEDTVCDIKALKCVSSTNQELPMWDKFPARLRADWEDHKQKKPETQRTTTSPTGTTSTTTATDQMTTLPAEQQGASSVSTDVPCNDTAACPDETTCCKTKDGGWACCPLPEAVCCEDFIHCCPHGKKCDVAAGSCDDPSGSVPWVEKVPVRPIRKQKVAATQVSTDVPCNDTAACPDETTCCKTKDGGWACCPLPEAVCCEDFVHCCPHGKKCNLAAASCDDPSGSVPWVEKVPVRPIKKQKAAVTQVSSVSTDVPCNDTAACPDETTCCKTKDGGWACCPLPEAVCCEDFIHCCPHGKKCDVAAGSCDDPSGSVPWVEKVPVHPIRKQKVAATKASSVSTDVPCNDTTACPDETTCCKTKDGGWACCPLPEAVCCEDFTHCCPHGKKCNIAAESCDDPSGSVPWVKKVPVHLRAGQRPSGKVNCNATHGCPESSTCCKNIAGEWGCCPFSQAVCCGDGFHCCPQGTSCDFVTLTCKSNGTSVPMSVLIPASAKEEQKKHEEVKVTVGKYDNRVPCDAQTSCPEYTTCCLIAKTNKWGCCPLPNAVCCTDGEHCCPAHYKCNMSSVSCIKGDVVIPWYNKIAAESTPAPRLDLGAVKCDEQSSCSADSTCCLLSKGETGCCPFPEAVCCPDQKHCCPEGYKCDLHRRSCVKTTWLYVEIIQLTHIRSNKPQPSVTVKDVQCGGGFSCNDGETCCPTSQTTWGCCPSPKAVCCDDMQHCCPTGYKCGPGGTCISAGDLDWSNWVNWKLFFSKNKRAISL